MPLTSQISVLSFQHLISEHPLSVGKPPSSIDSKRLKHSRSARVAMRFRESRRVSWVLVTHYATAYRNCLEQAVLWQIVWYK
ncbi:hypothetical protein H0G86_012669 [Trichoderma simmonsii]|uniref:Uncharacterized protein n=1 Tax=Trichoderma simmonsii TaxID=1491479 RepID=A0A8G0LNY4_9HYPO|nr:hypothetical protein H0G86_012669 [Trichoderma simmonsii]